MLEQHVEQRLDLSPALGGRAFEDLGFYAPRPGRQAAAWCASTWARSGQVPAGGVVRASRSARVQHREHTYPKIDFGGFMLDHQIGVLAGSCHRQPPRSAKAVRRDVLPATGRPVAAQAGPRAAGIGHPDGAA